MPNERLIAALELKNRGELSDDDIRNSEFIQAGIELQKRGELPSDDSELLTQLIGQEAQEPDAGFQIGENVVKPVMQVLGGVGGGLLGGTGGAAAGGVGAIPGAALGAGLGYAAGGQLYERGSELLGLKEPAGLQQATLEAVRDVPIGAGTAALPGTGALTRIGATALGYAGGQQAYRRGQELAGERPAAGFTQAASEAAIDTGIGAALGGFGEGFGKAVGVVTQKAPQLKKEVAERLARFKEFDIEPTITQVTGSDAAALVEKSFDALPQSAIVSKGFAKAQDEAVKKATNALRAEFAAKAALRTKYKNTGWIDGISDNDLGQFLKRQISVKELQARGIASRKYDAMLEAIGAREVPIKNTQEEASKILVELIDKKRNIGADVPKSLTKTARKFAEGIQTRTGTGIDQLKKYLNDMYSDSLDAAGKPSFEGRQYLRLRQALEKDMDTFGEQAGGEITRRWKASNEFYKSMFAEETPKGLLRGREPGRFGSPEFKKIAKTNPEDIVAIIKPGQYTELARIKRMAGPEGWEAIKLKKVEQILSGDKSISKVLDAHSKEELALIFSPQEIGKIQRLGRVMDDMRAVYQMGGNPSGTARTILTAGQAGAVPAWFFNPSLEGLGVGAAVVITPPLMAKLWLSQKGRNLILAAMTAPPASRQAATIAKQLITAMSEKEDRE